MPLHRAALLIATKSFFVFFLGGQARTAVVSKTSGASSGMIFCWGQVQEELQAGESGGRSTRKPEEADVQ